MTGPRATQAETNEKFGTGQSGLYVGRYYHEDTKEAGDKIIYEGERHALLFGPNGTGKGTRFLMVNLLSDCLNGRSIIVIDPKGELAAVTAAHRHRRGDNVKILDPFGKLRDAISGDPQTYKYLAENALVDSAGFNPLSALTPGILRGMFGMFDQAPPARQSAGGAGQKRQGGE